MSEKLPIADYITVKAGDKRGAQSCIVTTQDGQKFVLPIKGFTKSYPHDDMSEATLTIFGFRLHVEDDGDPFPAVKFDNVV